MDMAEKTINTEADHVERPPQDDVLLTTTSDEKVTRTVFLFALFTLVSAIVASFDLGFGGTVLLMPSFNTAFGPCHEVLDPKTGVPTKVCQVTALQQSLVSLTTLFIAIGSGVSGVTGTYLGRRGTLQVGSAVVIVAAAGMLGTAGNFTNYMVCKCISGLGEGLLYFGTLVYAVECLPPQKRGLLVGLFTIGISTGQALVSGVCAGTATIGNNWEWKTPIILQIPLSLLIATSVMLFPESPRWCIQKGNEQRARAALGRFYHKDPQGTFVTAHVREIQAYVNWEREMAPKTSWIEIFHRKNIRRTLISIWILSASSLTGAQFVGNYTAIFLGGVGIQDPFVITAIINLCFFGGSLFGGIVTEFAGRRLTFLIGLVIDGLCMLTFSAVASGLAQSSPTAQKVLVAFLCIWSFVYSMFVASAGWILSAEVHSIRLRSYGQAMTGICAQILGFAAQFWTPYMLGKITVTWAPTSGTSTLASHLSRSSLRSCSSQRRLGSNWNKLMITSRRADRHGKRLWAATRALQRTTSWNMLHKEIYATSLGNCRTQRRRGHLKKKRGISKIFSATPMGDKPSHFQLEALGAFLFD